MQDEFLIIEFSRICNNLFNSYSVHDYSRSSQDIGNIEISYLGFCPVNNSQRDLLPELLTNWVLVHYWISKVPND